ncbi:hypothetical protein FE374_01585 [Georgenia yuyongxinii]|uniref:Uncharacterized protein n=1 Tax=Georgenia yuyongxinii TaxID=2589797 RepID=A0A5B8C2P5_9MICO|nr:hypothetical protein [Georgenia yuyongxinii]QDC23495.1 hypothetical protein FE374_01585 [Georgenia yuyongxinii]
MTAHEAEGRADLAAVAEALYALVPGEFTRARNDRATQLRADGEKDLADAVKALPKPSAGAWLVNMMVRQMSEEIGQVLELGAALRQAQEQLDAAQLRALNTQRRRLTSAVVRQAVKVAAGLGQKVSPAVADQAEATLHAAMTDDGAAAALRTGLLVAPMEAVGLSGVDLAGVVAVPGAMDHVPRTVEAEAAAEESPARRLTVVPDRTRLLEEATEALEAAQFLADGAARALRKAEDHVSRLEARGLQLRAEIEELQRQIDERETTLQSVEDDLGEADEQREAAVETYDEAQAALDAARQKVAKLKRRR